MYLFTIYYIGLLVGIVTTIRNHCGVTEFLAFLVFSVFWPFAAIVFLFLLFYKKVIIESAFDLPKYQIGQMFSVTGIDELTTVTNRSWCKYDKTWLYTFTVHNGFIIKPEPALDDLLKHNKHIPEI